jgi:hypothetical protein
MRGEKMSRSTWKLTPRSFLKEAKHMHFRNTHDRVPEPQRPAGAYIINSHFYRGDMNDRSPCPNVAKEHGVKNRLATEIAPYRPISCAAPRSAGAASFSRGWKSPFHMGRIQGPPQRAGARPRRRWESVRISAPPRGALQCAPFLGWLAFSAVVRVGWRAGRYPTVIFLSWSGGCRGQPTFEIEYFTML